MDQKAWDVGCGMWVTLTREMIQPRVIVVVTGCGVSAILESMYGYQSLNAWKRAHKAAMLILRETSRANHPRTFALYDQLRRAALSVPANIVEGYALGTPALYRKHLRIPLGSAAEAEYFPHPTPCSPVTVDGRRSLSAGFVRGYGRASPAPRPPSWLQPRAAARSEEHTSELQSPCNL